MKYEVLTHFAYGWENCWTDEDEAGNLVPVSFPSREAAQTELDEYLRELRFERPEDFRIICRLPEDFRIV